MEEKEWEEKYKKINGITKNGLQHKIVNKEKRERKKRKVLNRMRKE